MTDTQKEVGELLAKLVEIKAKMAELELQQEQVKQQLAKASADADIRRVGRLHAGGDPSDTVSG